ncbi:glycosyltransferase family 39 protein, partial [Candidatus Saganbacteria bacterium]|nr:glycosyltransferase family 39 protein [Candidatus Saganbacteria bacterium]
MFSRKALIFLFFILLTQFTLRVPFLQEPLERDEGLYGYMGQRILAGELPYRDVFDHKPPAVYYIYAGIIKVFGSSLFSIRAAAAVYSLFTTAAIFGVGFLLMGLNGGLLSAFLYALFSGGPLIQGASANTEAFMVLPMVLALWCFLRAFQNSPHPDSSDQSVVVDSLSLREREVKINRWKNEKLGEGM